MATVFEREYAGIFELYGDYRQLPSNKLKQWIGELKNIDAETFTRDEVYSKWKFYHPEQKERWIAYRTGTWLVDQVLERYKLTILDLNSKSAADVLRMSEE